MVTIEIPEELDAEIQQAADQRGCSKLDFVREAVEAHIEEQFAATTEFSEDQIARFRHSIDQLNRGEYVTSEHIDKKFEDWRNKRSASA